MRTRGVGARPSSTRFLMSLVICAAVIVGLLGMHTMSTAGAGHDAAGSAALHAAAAQHAPASLGTDEPPCDCQPAAPSPEQHSMLLMACALALLATLLVLSRPRLHAVLSATRCIRAAAVEHATGTLAHPRPPSLLVLSISRT